MPSASLLKTEATAFRLIRSKNLGKILPRPRDGRDKDETSTGLGLSFVKEVVEQHGGTVFVESESSQGSKFSFTLPRL